MQREGMQRHIKRGERREEQDGETCCVLMAVWNDFVECDTIPWRRLRLVFFSFSSFPLFCILFSEKIAFVLFFFSCSF